jgi:uncharacterized membrane protein
MKPYPNTFYAAALIGFFGLFALLMLWHTVLVPPSQFPVALVLLATVTPLLLPMRGLLSRDRKSCIWMAYISLFYFVHGSTEVYSNPDERLYAVLETVLSLMLLLGTTFYLRFSSKPE